MSASLLAPVDGSMTRSSDLAKMSLADCPSYTMAVAAGLAHGLSPDAALDAAFGKFLTEHADAIQAFDVANFYDGKDAPRAFVNYTRLTRFLMIKLADQGSEMIALRQELRELAGIVQNRIPAAASV